MKPRKRIEEIFRTVRPANMSEYNEILLFCRSRRIYLPENLYLDSALPPVSSERFKEWFLAPEPSVGQPICIDSYEIIGFVQKVNFDSFLLGPYIDASGRLIQDKTSIPTTTFRLPSEEECRRMQIAMSKLDLAWSKTWKSCIRKYTPSTKEQVVVKLLGESLGVGIFKNFDSNGNLVMFCYVPYGGSAAYSLNEIIGSHTHYQMQKPDRYDRSHFERGLSNNGVRWKGKIGRVERIGYRAHGSTYFFINSFFKVESATDMGKRRDNQLFNCGNYFPNQSQATEFIRAVAEYRKKQLSSQKVVDVIDDECSMESNGAK